jgi:hypothetical protein
VIAQSQCWKNKRRKNPRARVRPAEEIAQERAELRNLKRSIRPRGVQALRAALAIAISESRPRSFAGPTQRQFIAASRNAAKVHSQPQGGESS